MASSMSLKMPEMDTKYLGWPILEIIHLCMFICQVKKHVYSKVYLKYFQGLSYYILNYTIVNKVAVTESLR